MPQAGPFDKLAAATANYVAPSKEKGTPHRYVLHNTKDVPECTNCHTEHSLDPLPKEGSIDLSQVSVKWCYDLCHHTKTLVSCKPCHP